MWTDSTAFIIGRGDNVIQQRNMTSRKKKVLKLSMCWIGTNTCARLIGRSAPCEIPGRVETNKPMAPQNMFHHRQGQGIK